MSPNSNSLDLYYHIIDKRWKDLKAKKVVDAEARALKQHISSLSGLLQTSLVTISYEACAKDLLSEEEKAKAADPASQHNRFYIRKLLETVVTAIEKDPSRLDDFFNIVERKIGGPAAGKVASMRKQIG